MAKEKLWGGRFHEGTAASVEAYTQSISYDWALYKQDIAGSCAHARMLARQGVISAEEADQLVAGLAAVRAEIEDGTFQWKKELEDVHMNIESRLTELVGDVGKKLHTGRSRNDQVALDFRLFVSDRLREWQRLARELAAVCMARALTAGFLNATELADYLVTKGIPFREAHHITGSAVALAEGKNLSLEALPLDALQGLCDRIGPDVFDVLEYRAAVARRNAPGGTGPLSVARQLEKMKAWLHETK